MHTTSIRTPHLISIFQVSKQDQTKIMKPLFANAPLPLLGLFSA